MANLSCPNCNHHFDADDMLHLPIDIWQLAKDEEDTQINCPSCNKDFWVIGKCSLSWNSYKSPDDMEYAR